MEFWRIQNFLCILSFLHVVCGQEGFSHNVQHYREDIGENVFVKSSGTTRNIIDLDDRSVVKRIMCKEMMIKVSLNKPSEALNWKKGDVVVGSSDLGCNINFMHPDRPGIFAKVLSKKEMGNNRVDLSLEYAHPLDVLEEATISMHVTKDHERAIHSVRKRSATNFLSQPLDTINWHENISTTVKFNSDEKKISIVKNSTKKLPETYIQDKSDTTSWDGSEFIFSCVSCVGETSISYHLDIEIHRNLQTNKPMVKRYISQVEGSSTNIFKFAINSSREQTLTSSSKLWSTEPVTVTVIELAKFKKFPTIQLTLNTSTEAFIELYATSNTGDIYVEGLFETDGDFVISKEYSNNTGNDQASLYNWRTVNGGKNYIVSNSSFYFNVNVSQLIHINPYIGWKEKDVLIDFAANFSIRLDQGIVSSSNKTISSFCLTSNSNVTGDFETDDNAFIARAFGLTVWNQLLAQKQRQLESKMTNQLLSSSCKANCFRAPFESGIENATMEDVCGAVTSPIVRNSDDFYDLRKIFGDLMLFADEEYHGSTWCSTQGNNCTSCDDYEGDDNVCADRLMTSQLASAITRLASFAEVEWPDRKLVILEAYDEPTSANPSGQHGAESLFYEGRAARVGISKPLSSMTGKVEVDNNADIYLRFRELLSCSGFTYMSEHVSDSVLDICVTQDSGTESTYRRRRKKAAISNNMAISNNYKEEVEDFISRMIQLDVSSNKITSANYFASGSVYPKGTTALSVCGPADEKYQRQNNLQMNRIVQYPFENVEFDPEGPANNYCGTKTRQCQTCSQYTYSDNPWDWCGPRMMAPRLSIRVNRLSQLINIKKGIQTKSSTGIQPTSSTATVVPSGWTNEEYGVCRRGGIAFQTKSECKKVMPDSSTESEKCDTCIKETRCCLGSGNSNLGCMQSDCDASPDDSIWRAITCKAVNPFKSGVTISPSPACNSGNDKKMILFDNVCSGDPCLFFNGREYYMLLKVVMIFEVCSGLWNEASIDNDMSNANVADGELMTYFKTCLNNAPVNVLKLHRDDPKLNDPTIGIGYSLRESSQKPTERKDRLERILPNINYDAIMNKSGSISEKQALYLYGVVMRDYIRSINSIVPFEKFVFLPLNVRLAIVNANYRGEWSSKIKKEFKKAVQSDKWAEAKAAYMTHPNYKSCGNKKTSVCTRMKWNAKQFDTMIIKSVKIINKTNRRKRSTGSTGTSVYEALHDKGQATTFTAIPGSSVDAEDIANMAVLAGFDHVTYTGSQVEVCVKPSAGFISRLIQYPNVNLHAADPPTTDTEEYRISEYAKYSLSYPMLLDGNDEKMQLSPCYKISDVKSRGYRYFRFDPLLLQCLEEVSDYYGSCVKIITDSAYRVRTINNDNMDDRHEEEKWRFTTGQAVAVIPKGDATHVSLRRLALMFMNSCTHNLMLRRLKLGIGSHSNHIYVDIREKNDPSDSTDLWSVDNDKLDKYLKEITEKGGPFIRPTNKERACKDPPLGPDNYYVKNPDKLCLLDFSGGFCQNSESARKEAAKNLAKELSDKAGSGVFPLSTAQQKVDACMVNTCGGCVGSGNKWKEKTKNCLDLINSFIKVATAPFPEMKDNAAFYNTDNADSHVHSLACHDGSVCIENIPLHSSLIKAVNSKFKPKPTMSNEELIFDPGSNPTPILHLLEQEMAMRVKGNVTVYIEKDTDLSGFYQLMKILLIYNTEVDFVNFHLLSSVKEKYIIQNIQNKIERWSTSVCPERSRVLVAPYTVQVVSEARRKRSVERSVDRNKVTFERKNWEINWLMSMT